MNKFAVGDNVSVIEIGAPARVLKFQKREDGGHRYYIGLGMNMYQWCDEDELQTPDEERMTFIDELATLREQVATLTAAASEVFIVEYRGNAWDEDNYKLIGVCSSYDRAVAFASEYLGLTFAFQSVSMSLVYPPERGVWVAMEVDITSFSARIIQVTLTH